VEPHTSISKATNLMPFKLLYGEEPVTPEEIKFQSTRTKLEVVYSPIEAKSKDLMEPERMKVVENLQVYQNEMRTWRNRKVKEKIIEVRDLVLLRSPCKRPPTS
jgi:tryptophan 2,3-dioxygenase